MRWAHLPAGVTLCWLVAAGAVGGQSFREEFDQAGGGAVAPTRFSVLMIGADGSVDRGPTAAGLGVPSTNGVLPIDVGGDSELRFFEAVAPRGTAIARTPETSYADVAIDAYIVLGRTGFGTLSGTLLARSTGTSIGTHNAYGAILRDLEPSTRTLALVRVRNGVLQNLATSSLLSLDLANENYHVFLRVVGSRFSASILRVQVIAEKPIETLIDLDTNTPGVQSELVVTDSELTAGAVGMSTFTRSTNSVLFDDVTVEDIVFSDGFESGDTAAWSLVVP